MGRGGLGLRLCSPSTPVLSHPASSSTQFFSCSSVGCRVQAHSGFCHLKIALFAPTAASGYYPMSHLSLQPNFSKELPTLAVPTSLPPVYVSILFILASTPAKLTARSSDPLGGCSRGCSPGHVCCGWPLLAALLLLWQFPKKIGAINRRG